MPVERIIDARSVSPVEGEAVGGEGGRRGALRIMVHVKHGVVQAARAPHHWHGAKPGQQKRTPSVA